MNWVLKFLRSSLGQKLIMGLTGLFLILFLVIHLIGNLQLLYTDQGEAFNVYAKFMTTNPLIKFTSYGLYFFILLHAVQGIVLAAYNRAARGADKYAVKVTRTTGTNAFAANNMALLGILIFAFLCIHMGDFWWAMKRDQLALAVYDGEAYQDLYAKVAASFSQWWIVLIYLVGQLALGFHLLHGFQSAFQTLGLNHRKYSGAIQSVGYAYSILIPLGFAIIPVVFFFFK